jgi:YD repeat-containing protein
MRSTYTYNAVNQVVSETNGLTGAVTEYKYTPAGAIKSLSVHIAGELVNHCEYEYNLLGNQTKKTENGEVTSYQYDALSRLKTPCCRTVISRSICTTITAT